MQVTEYTETKNGIIIQSDGNTRLRLEAWSKDIIRVSYTREAFTENSLPMINAKPQNVPFKVSDEEKFLTFTAGNTSVKINKVTFGIAFNKNGNNICRIANDGLHLTDTVITVPHYESDIESGEKVKLISNEELEGYRFGVSFDFEKNEKIYGLGQHGLGVLDRRKASVYLYQNNNTSPNPFFVSSKGYGVLFNTGAYSLFARDSYGNTFSTDSVDMGEFYFIAGDSIDESIKGYRMLTGKAPMMPKWLFGYTQCKEHYHTQEELLGVLREYRRRKVPIDQIVQDWFYWKKETWSDKSFDSERYPDPTAMVNEVHENNAHIMISVWPHTRGGDNFKEFFEKNQLLTGIGQGGSGGVYNAFDPAARDTYWSHLKNGILKHGFDAWWCDSSEPLEPTYGKFLSEDEHKSVAVKAYKEWMDSRKINLYPLYHCGGVYSHQRSENEDKRVVILTRSGYAGQQKNATIVWSGDIPSTFDELRRQIAEGLNFCASGIPYWTLDIGGFYSKSGFYSKIGPLAYNFDVPYDSVENPGYRELYTRWLQFGCFLPVFRSHGTNFPREIWQFGDEGDIYYESIRKFIELRYRLIPYIYSTAHQVTENDETFIRLLAFDYADDKKALEDEESYMFGHSLFVSPVTKGQYYEGKDTPIDADKTKDVYLPCGNDWYDFWSGKKYTGGQTVTVDTPIDSMPIFVKSGSIIPLSPVMQYVDEIPNAPYTLNVYPDADASFTLYEDSGEGYGYEKGEYAEYDIIWNDASRTLTVSDRRGDFDGMCKERDLIINVIGGKTATVNYSGKEISVKM